MRDDTGPESGAMTGPVILIADDDGTEQVVLSEALESDGFQVRCASDGLEALEAIRAEIPDLVILDILMPRLDGISALRQIRAESSDIRLPVIVTTGWDDAHAIRAAYDSGATDFLVKPVPERLLMERVRYVLRASAALRDLDRARQEAESAERMKTEFVGNVSHEMRTPINGVLGLTKLLLENEPTPEMADTLSMILDSTRRLQNTVEELLDFSELELGNLAIEESAFQLEGLLHECLLRHQQAALAAEITLSVRIDPGIPQVLRGDPKRLRQVLDNLVGNAIRFSGAGRVDLLARSRQLGARVELEVEVRDDGVGIPEAEQIRLLLPFTQKDGSMTRKAEGLGLGLSICARLAKLMKGRLIIDSRVERGSSFTLKVPLSECPVARENGAEAEQGQGLHLSRVLIAEDNPVNAKMLNHIVTKAGFSATIAQDGEEAIEVFSEDPEISIVLMDLHMPRVDGFEATRRIRIRARSAGRLPWIAAISAHADPLHRRQAFESGVDDFVSKPFEAGPLRQLLVSVAAEQGKLGARAEITEEVT